MKRPCLLLPVLLCALFAGGARAQDADSGTDGDAPPPKSRVVAVERPSVVSQMTANFPGVRQMWQDGFFRLTGKSTNAAAWKVLNVGPADIVGIKISTNGSELMSTRMVVVDAIVESLMDAGVPLSHIIVWDRDRQSIAGTPYGRPGIRPYRIASVIPETGFDPKVFYVNEVLGKLIWGDLLFRGKTSRNALFQQAEESAARANKDAGGVPVPLDPVKQEMRDQTSNRSYFANLETQTCTKIINVPVLIDNDSVGLWGCLSSLALGSVDNTRRFYQEGINGDPAVAEILDRDLFRKKVVLHVMDALVAQYAGGPAFTPQFTQSIGTLYLSTDPVAIDSLVVPRLVQWRAAAKVVPLGDRAKHVHGCAEQGLGNDDPKRIELIRLP